jgi:hypothetical protein
MRRGAETLRKKDILDGKVDRAQAWIEKNKNFLSLRTWRLGVTKRQPLVKAAFCC